VMASIAVGHVHQPTAVLKLKRLKAVGGRMDAQTGQLQLLLGTCGDRRQRRGYERIAAICTGGDRSSRKRACTTDLQAGEGCS